MALSFRANLPQKLYKAQQVRDNESIVAAKAGIEMFTLMENAGLAIWQLISEKFTKPSKMTVFAGHGNNGGDGYIIARLALNAGWQVKLIQAGQCSKICGDAKKARALYMQYGGKEYAIDTPLESGTVVVDSLLGSGLNGEVRGSFVELINRINECENQWVCSVDIPSGLCSDTGAVLGVAVKADATCTFIGVKQGLLTGRGPDYCGRMYFAGLGISDLFEQMICPSAMTLEYDDLFDHLPKRKPSSHKGHFGHVLLIGGNKGMSGAIRMAAQAALRSGAGLVSVVTHPGNVFIVASSCAEIMVSDKLDGLLERCDVVVFGPGAGQDDWSLNWLNMLLDCDKPMVIDADGLNLLAQTKLKQSSRQWVLTPHPKEASRLLDCDVMAIERDRVTNAEKLSEKYDAVCLLKGVGTVISGLEQKIINISGNPGMATAGMGDVLSGIIGGFLAQGLSLLDAAAYGALIHGLAGDRAAKDGQRGMMATDLLLPIRFLVNGKYE